MYWKKTNTFQNENLFICIFHKKNWAIKFPKCCIQHHWKYRSYLIWPIFCLQFNSNRHEPLKKTIFYVKLTIWKIFLSSNICSIKGSNVRSEWRGNQNLKKIGKTSNFNPTLHRIKNVAVDMGGGHYGHPLENDTRGHFCGKIDL